MNLWKKANKGRLGGPGVAEGARSTLDEKECVEARPGSIYSFGGRCLIMGSGDDGPVMLVVRICAVLSRIRTLDSWTMPVERALPAVRVS